MWYKSNVYGIADSAKVMEASVAVQKAMDVDDRIGFFLSVNAGFLVAGMLFRGPASEAVKAFSAFDGITPMQVAVPETEGTQLSGAHAFSLGAVGR